MGFKVYFMKVPFVNAKLLEILMDVDTGDESLKVLKYMRLERLHAVQQTCLGVLLQF